jgi:lipopolysaccharide transport system ATP-binding protein
VSLATKLNLRLRYGAPGFIIPGAQKCGTTALAVFLERHPRLRLATTKEPDFFLRDARYQGLGLEHYRRLFPKRRLLGNELFFEASVGYLSDPSVPERLAAFDPALRFVVMVRDPALRALSAWNHYRTLVTIPRERARFEAWLQDHNSEDRAAGLALLAQPRFPSFAEALGDELDAIARGEPNWTLPALVAGGLYATQVERFFAFYPGDRFLILEDRELAEDPAETLNRVLAFLRLAPHDWGDTFPKVFPGEYDKPADSAVLDRLRAFYAPHNQRFFELSGRRFDWGGAEHSG